MVRVVQVVRVVRVVRVVSLDDMYGFHALNHQIIEKKLRCHAC